MKFYVYILYSKNSNIYYKGMSHEPYKRLQDHNKDLSVYTKHKGPWDLVYLESFARKSEALMRERKLKQQKQEYLRWLILQPINELNRK